MRIGLKKKNLDLSFRHKEIFRQFSENDQVKETQDKKQKNNL